MKGKPMPPHEAQLERRREWRYHFGQPLRLCVSRRGASCQTVGQTVELNGTSALIRTESPLLVGESVAMRIRWPVPMQDVCPVALVVQGIVLRTDARGAVLRVRDYLFEIEGPGSRDFCTETGTACDVTG
ncbi:MAG TPA: hypothetical protein VMI94_23810 [Bryobacteraceae bacterium]|nr:hypothetical protein [Bryobacteraceae bacterium]